MKALFDALWQVGLDRRRVSIHEMLTDVLEVVAVAAGLKPAHLSGHGEAAAWQIDAFERIAADFGLSSLRTPPLPPPAARHAGLSGDYPRLAAALRAEPPAPAAAARVLWIFRQPAQAAAIERLVGGEAGLLPAVLGYPPCCVAYDRDSDGRFAAALLQLYAEQHGVVGEAAVLQALRGGLTVHGAVGASAALETLWRTRIVFPYLGHNACRLCLADAQDSPSAAINRQLRALAFSLDPGFAHGLWRAALAEAALATTGNFQGLDPAPADRCPCGSARSYQLCCAALPVAMPDFR